MKKRCRARWIATLGVSFLHGLGFAQVNRNVTGEWSLTLGKRTLMVLSIKPATDQNSGQYRGSLSRPALLQTVDSFSFSHVEGPTEIEPIVSANWKGNVLSITVQDPQD